MSGRDRPVLSFCDISKRFGGTVAVDGVDLDLFPGEVLALLGQNGAGKSTLIKILAGVHRPDSGSVELHGAGAESVSFIHQDLGLIEWMTVAENVALGQGYRRRAGLIDWRGVRSAARRSLELLAHDIDPEERVGNLTRSEKSLVGIARALGAGPRVLVLDEPTASLPHDEVETLFRVLRRLRQQGVAMIYVTHRLDEVYAISDRLAVMRDGALVGVRATRETEPAELVGLIVGRPPESVFVRPERVPGRPLLRCEGLAAEGVGPLDFEIEAGEIVGLVGLRGAGHELVGRVLFGLVPPETGAIRLGDRPLEPRSPTDAMRRGVGLVAGDRAGECLGAGLTVRENMFLNPAATGRGPLGWRSASDEAAEAARLGRHVGLKPNDPEAIIETLSGGNQQKVVMARWMRVGGAVLVLEDPTAGVDVGAKGEIYRLLAEAVASGLAVVLISTDFEEVARVCHRALVFREGLIADELGTGDLSIERLTWAATYSGGGADPRAAAA
jgi:ribose transport system ATP-binding protein